MASSWLLFFSYHSEARSNKHKKLHFNNKISPVPLTGESYLRRIRYNRWLQNCTEFWVCSGAQINSYPHFPRLFPTLFEMGTRDLHWALWNSCFLEIGARSTFYGRKWNYIYDCIVEGYDTFKVKYALLQSVYYITGHTIYSRFNTIIGLSVGYVVHHIS